MNVPARIYTDERLLEKIKQDKTLQQAINVATLPGIQKFSYVMPDAHQGYGFPIGGVAAFDMEDGIISPGGVGYDINCGVRLLRTDFKASDILEKRKELLNEIYREVPVGVGKAGITKLSKSVLLEVLSRGAEWAVSNNYGKKEDLKKIEENGCFRDADPSCITNKALERGAPQLGTLGSGNHFLEIQKVDRIYDFEIAETFGITGEGQVTIMIHCGSRGLGHQTASDYIMKMEQKYGYKHLTDRELINAPVNSDLGREYYKAMSSAINYAFANRQMIMHWTRNAFRKVMKTDEGIDLVYDVCHNIAKFEYHRIEGKNVKLCVHRKGATRSFGPAREETPSIYRRVGQPVIIPGSMGTASYLLVGTDDSEELSFGSACHGAGRVSSRTAALHHYRGEKVRDDLLKKGIELKSCSWKGVAEEAPEVYKNIDEVVEVTHNANLARKVARLVPLGVIKG
jgi:tRNA-splicing ligase RtcB